MMIGGTEVNMIVLIQNPNVYLTTLMQPARDSS